MALRSCEQCGAVGEPHRSWCTARWAVGRVIPVQGELFPDQKLDALDVEVTPIYHGVYDRTQAESRAIIALADGASGNRALEEAVLRRSIRAYRLWQERQLKYGEGNIARHGALGCLIRDTDKTARLEEFYLHGRKDNMPDESVVDSWLDKVNYALMGLICFEGDWPGSPEQKEQNK